MDIIRLYQDYSIDFVTEGHKHARPGWVNCECPFCSGLPGSNPGYHLGWNLNDEYFFCWRCGWHPPLKTISLLLTMPEVKVKGLLIAYNVNRSIIRYKKVKQEEIKSFKLPARKKYLDEPHRQYLQNRGFDPDKLEKEWGLMSTGPLGWLGSLDYRFRIIIPIFWNGQMVSFDSRDITGKQMAKYKACPGDMEKVPHKEILYGNQEEWGETGICVEGPTDVWRLGPKAFATSGIEYTHVQVRVMAQTFKRVWVVFDEEEQAQRQAKKLVAELKFRGVSARNWNLGQDPGSLPQDEADKLVKAFTK